MAFFYHLKELTMEETKDTYMKLSKLLMKIKKEKNRIKEEKEKKKGRKK
jgi:hypothetical protein